MPNKTYDSNYLEKLNTLFAKTKSKSFDLLNLQGNEIIADIGCGFGDDAFQLSKLCHKIIGFDIDENFIKIANSKYIDSNIEFKIGNAYNLPMTENSLDAIRYDRVLQHISDYDKLFNEAKRVLKPNGKIQIIDTDYSSLSLFLGNIQFERKIIDLILFDRLPNSYKVREVPDFLVKYGFKIKSIEIVNHIITDFELANFIIRFDKIINEEKNKNQISNEEFAVWQNLEKDKFNFLLNLVIVTAENT